MLSSPTLSRPRPHPSSPTPTGAPVSLRRSPPCPPRRPPSGQPPLPPLALRDCDRRSLPGGLRAPVTEPKGGGRPGGHGRPPPRVSAGGLRSFALCFRVWRLGRSATLRTCSLCFRNPALSSLSVFLVSALTFCAPRVGGEHPDFTWVSRCPDGAPAASTALGSPGPAAGTIRTGPAFPFSPAPRAAHPASRCCPRRWLPQPPPPQRGLLWPPHLTGLPAVPRTSAAGFPRAGPCRPPLPPSAHCRAPSCWSSVEG